MAVTASKAVGRTITVTDVELGDFISDTAEVSGYLRKTILDKGRQKLLSGAISTLDTPVLTGGYVAQIKHPVVAAALMAFAEHFPLVLRPQHFWLMISQTVALHVTANAKALRTRFVTFTGQKVLKIDVTKEVVAGMSAESWAQIVRNFGSQVQDCTVDGVAQKIGCNGFSNTTDAEEVASLMTLMDCCQSFFVYKCETRCGIPSVTLEGTVADWELLRDKTEKLVTDLTLKAFSKNWLPAVLPILDILISERKGEENGVVSSELFWNSITKQGGARNSGEPAAWITGWINVFFPNPSRPTQSNERECCKPFDFDAPKQQYDHYDTRRNDKSFKFYPNGLSTAPATLDEFPLELQAGFLGVTQDPSTKSVTPLVGWYIATAPLPEGEPEPEFIMTNIGVKVPLDPFIKRAISNEADTEESKRACRTDS